MRTLAGTIMQGRAVGALHRTPARRAWLALLLTPWVAAQTPEPAAPDAAPITDAAAQPAVAVDPREAALAQREAAQQTFLRLMDEKRYEEAVTIAAQIVELTTRMDGDRSLELAAPLVNLATARMLQGDLAGAERDYKAAIAIIEREDGLGSPRLVNPLTGLGETYVRGGLYPQADEAYKRALQTNHVAAGFYNLEQMKILDGLSESYLGLDKLGQANAQQRAQVAIQERRSGENSRDLVPALDKLGRWYNRTGQYPESRAAYQSARRIIRETGGDSDPAMVDALLGEALTYENEGAMPAAASALKRALDLLAARPGENQLKRAEVLVALGDHYNVTRQFRSARQRYAQAWQELSGDDALLSQREEYFRAPTRISGPRLPEFVGADGKETQGPRNAPVEFAEGIVVATLTVSPDGQAIDTAIIESDPPGLLDKQLLRTMAASAFRPQLVDGSGVPSPGIQFRHPFRYQRPSPERPEVRAEPAAEPTGEKGKRIGYPGQPDGADGDPQR